MRDYTENSKKDLISIIFISAKKPDFQVIETALEVFEKPE
jgi:hypothetical protein